MHGPRARTGPLRAAKPVPHPSPVLPARIKARGTFGGANLELTPPLAGKAGHVINDLFLIRLFCPLQPCAGIFGTEVSGNDTRIGKRMNSPPIAWVAWK